MNTSNDRRNSRNFDFEQNSGTKNRYYYQKFWEPSQKKSLKIPWRGCVHNNFPN